MNFHFPSYKKLSTFKNYLILSSLLFFSCISVWFFGKNPLLASIPILAIGILFLLYIKSWKLFIVYVLFASLGTIQEIFFISRGLWFYSKESFLLVPLYLPFVWGNIGLIAVSAFKGIRMIDRKKRLLHNPPNFWLICIITFCTGIAAILSIRLFYLETVKIVTILICIDIVYIFLMRSIPLAFVGLFSMIGGAVGDLVSVSLNLWSYPLENTFAGVPPYIFIGWDVIGLLIVGLYLALDSSDAPLPRWMKDKTEN
jgi:uncharacterized membrane protein YoaT (DUF817 family)